MNRLFILLLALSLTHIHSTAQRQTLDLEEAYRLLEERYPALKNSLVLQQLYDQKVESINKGRLPDLYIKGDSKLQSENLTIEGDPGSPVPFEFELPLWSAKGYVEIQYNILNGKSNDVREAIEAYDLRTDLQEIEVDRYDLQAIINDLFVNITMLREQEKLYDLSVQDLRTRRQVVQAAVDNGVALSSEVGKLSVRILEMESQQKDLIARQKGLLVRLEQMTGEDLAPEVELTFPNLGPESVIPEVQRPEKELFRLQKESIIARADLVDLERRPYLGVFAQGGAGYPNPVNFFDTGFAPYGIVGINFAWRITDWNKNELDKQFLQLQAQQVEYAEETFDFNLQTAEESYLTEVDRIRDLITTDEAISDLQTEILQQMSAQLDEGVITSSDYLIQANAELQARQSMAIHQIELLKLQLEFWNSRGSL